MSKRPSDAAIEHVEKLLDLPPGYGLKCGVSDTIGLSIPSSTDADQDRWVVRYAARRVGLAPSEGKFLPSAEWRAFYYKIQELAHAYDKEQEEKAAEKARLAELRESIDAVISARQAAEATRLSNEDMKRLRRVMRFADAGPFDRHGPSKVWTRTFDFGGEPDAQGDRFGPSPIEDAYRWWRRVVTDTPPLSDDGRIFIDDPFRPTRSISWGHDPAPSPMPPRTVNRATLAALAELGQRLCLRGHALAAMTAGDETRVLVLNPAKPYEVATPVELDLMRDLRMGNVNDLSAWLNAAALLIDAQHGRVGDASAQVALPVIHEGSHISLGDILTAGGDKHLTQLATAAGLEQPSAAPVVDSQLKHAAFRVLGLAAKRQQGERKADAVKAANVQGLERLGAALLPEGDRIARAGGTLVLCVAKGGSAEYGHNALVQRFLSDPTSPESCFEEVPGPYRMWIIKQPLAGAINAAALAND